MKESSTMLPRSSDSLTSAPATSGSEKSGAGRITARLGAVVSRPPGDAAGDGGCPQAAGAAPTSSAAARAPSWRRPISVQQHVVSARGAARKFGEVHVEERIDLEPAVGADVHETDPELLRVVHGRQQRVGDVHALAVAGDVHHVR